MYHDDDLAAHVADEMRSERRRCKRGDLIVYENAGDLYVGVVIASYTSIVGDEPAYDVAFTPWTEPNVVARVCTGVAQHQIRQVIDDEDASLYGPQPAGGGGRRE